MTFDLTSSRIGLCLIEEAFKDANQATTPTNVYDISGTQVIRHSKGAKPLSSASKAFWSCGATIANMDLPRQRMFTYYLAFKQTRQ